MVVLLTLASFFDYWNQLIGGLFNCYNLISHSAGRNVLLISVICIVDGIIWLLVVCSFQRTLCFFLVFGLCPSLCLFLFMQNDWRTIWKTKLLPLKPCAQLIFFTILIPVRNAIPLSSLSTTIAMIEWYLCGSGKYCYYWHLVRSPK